MDGTDLKAISEADWAPVRVPPGWRPIADACRKMGMVLPAFCERVAAEVTAEIPDPRIDPGSTDREGASSQRQLLAYLLLRPAILGIAENRTPHDSETAVAAVIGGAWAELGGSPDDILRAFQIAFRSFLSELASYVDPGERERLFESVSTLWGWLQEMSDAAAHGYREQAARLAALHIDTRERFFSALQRGDVASDTARQLARSLGFDAGGTFRAFWMRSAVDLSQLHASTHNLPGMTHAISHGTELAIISQGVPVDHLAEALRLLSPDAPCGVGMEREHLEGARMSLVDATWAVQLSQVSGRAIRFEDDWLLATLHAQRDQLSLLLDPGVRATVEQGHLSEAVFAFAANGFSQSAAARELHLRPNSLGYRLHRWADLVGRGVTTPDGLVYALLSRLLARADEK